MAYRKLLDSPASDVNQTGIAIASGTQPSVSGRRARFDSTGALSNEGAATTFLSFGGTVSIGNNSYVTGSTFSNTASGWLGGEFNFSGFASGNASGNLVLFLETSPDAGTTWPSPASANGAGGGMVIAVLGFASTTTASTASTTRVVNFEL